MYKPISLCISLRYFWNSHLTTFKKITTILSLLGISITIAVLIIIISIINGAENNFKKNILSFIPHLIITNKDKYINQQAFPKDILKSSRIIKYSSFIQKEVIVKRNDDVTMGEIISVDTANYNDFINYNIKNIIKKLQPGDYHIIMGKELAKKINARIGDSVELILLSDQTNHFAGKIFNKCLFKITGLFSTNHEIDYYQMLINEKDSLNFLKYAKNYITGWRIWLKDPLFLNFSEIKTSIQKLDLLDWTLQKGEFFKAMIVEKYMITSLFFLVLLIFSFNIFITLTVYTVEKKHTIAILKTQGLSNWKIIWIFVMLGSITVTIGSILGTIIAIILITNNQFLQFFLNIFFNNMNIPIEIIPFQVFLIDIISILLAIFSTLYPSWNAIRFKPAKILSNE